MSTNPCRPFSVHHAGGKTTLLSFFLQSNFCSDSNYNNSKLATLLCYKYPVQQDEGKSRQERPFVGQSLLFQ